jgi:hypothetical protein
MQYSDLNQPQTITAPTTVRPYSEFQSKVSAFIQGLQGAAAGVLGSGGSSAGGGTSSGGGSSSSSGGASPGGAGSSSSVTKYGQCIQQANGDVAKMQKCASLLGSGG